MSWAHLYWNKNNVNRHDLEETAALLFQNFKLSSLIREIHPDDCTLFLIIPNITKAGLLWMAAIFEQSIESFGAAVAKKSFQYK